MKTVIVYDWIDRWGGVERLLLELHHLFPDADFFTSAVDLKKAPWAKQLTIKTSFLQYLPDIIKKSRIASLLFYPFAFESLSFEGYDLVISVTSSFAKSIITKPQTKHICILLTPSRYLFLYPHPFENGLFSFLLLPYLSFIRRWDKIAAQRPDKIVAISEEVSKRCKTHYRRESTIIYPPFNLDHWDKLKNKLHNQSRLLPEGWDEYYLVVSRLEPYKNVNLVIEAFNLLPQNKLVVVGKGSLLIRYKKLSQKNIIFLHDLDDAQLASLYSNAKALIMMQCEDFGYTALEAQFFGCPVLAYGRGGALETIIEEKTGIFFSPQTSRSLVATLERFDKISYNFKRNMQDMGYNQAQRFGTEVFITKLKHIL